MYITVGQGGARRTPQGILLIEIFNAVLYWNMCTFYEVLISFYNKMTIKPQNDAIYGRNNSIIIFPFKLASCLIAGARRLFELGKTPFVRQTVTAKPNP